MSNGLTLRAKEPGYLTTLFPQPPPHRRAKLMCKRGFAACSSQEPGKPGMPRQLPSACKPLGSTQQLTVQPHTLAPILRQAALCPCSLPKMPHCPPWCPCHIPVCLSHPAASLCRAAPWHTHPRLLSAPWSQRS